MASYLFDTSRAVHTAAAGAARAMPDPPPTTWNPRRGVQSQPARRRVSRSARGDNGIGANLNRRRSQQVPVAGPDAADRRLAPEVLLVAETSPRLSISIVTDASSSCRQPLRCELPEP